jgi:anthranilate phosphoribosyltransferase
LLNPAGARRQVMGVYAARLVPLVAEAMTMLGTTHALVVHGDGGLDELALSGPSEMAEVRDGAARQRTIAPEELGLRRAPVKALAGGDAAANAAILRAIFAGEDGAGEDGADEAGPRREIVLLNAAAVLMVAGVAKDLPGGVAAAAEAIDSGAVTRLVEAVGR